jgi:hypothetical protein
MAAKGLTFRPDEAGQSAEEFIRLAGRSRVAQRDAPRLATRVARFEAESARISRRPESVRCRPSETAG